MKFEIQNMEYSSNDNATTIKHKQIVIDKMKKELKQFELDLGVFRPSVGSKAAIYFTVLRIEISPMKIFF